MDVVSFGRSVLQTGFRRNSFRRNGFRRNGFRQNGFRQNDFRRNGFGRNAFGRNVTDQVALRFYPGLPPIDETVVNRGAKTVTVITKLKFIRYDPTYYTIAYIDRKQLNVWIYCLHHLQETASFKISLFWMIKKILTMSPFRIPKVLNSATKFLTIG